MNNVYIVITAVVALAIAVCLWEVWRLRAFLRVEKEKRLQRQAAASRLKMDSVLSGFEDEKRNVLEVLPEYNKIKDEEKEVHDRLLKEALDKVRAEEERTKKRLEQEAVVEIIRDVIRNFRHSVYQRVNQPKLKEAKAKKKLISKSKAFQGREKQDRAEKEQEKEALRQEEQRRQEQEKEREKQRQEEERRQKEEKNQKEQSEKEQRQQQDVRQKVMKKRGVDSSESKSSKASETHISEMEIKPEGISVSKVVSEAGKAAVKTSAKASGGR